MSKDALQSSLELANSKSPPLPLAPLIASFILNPFPSSKFFFTLSLGSGEIFLASPVLKNPFPQEVKIRRDNVSKIILLNELKIFVT